MSNDLTIKSQTVGRALQRYQSVVDDFDREMARILGVNGTDIRCLELLIAGTGDEVTPGDIAAHLNLTAGSVTTMLDRLEKHGYVTRSPHPDDRRQVLVHATDTATERASALIGPLVEDGQRTLLTRYTLDQLELITDFLDRAAGLQRDHVQRLRRLPD